MVHVPTQVHGQDDVFIAGVSAVPSHGEDSDKQL